MAQSKIEKSKSPFTLSNGKVLTPEQMNLLIGGSTKKNKIQYDAAVVALDGLTVETALAEYTATLTQGNNGGNNSGNNTDTPDYSTMDYKQLSALFSDTNTAVHKTFGKNLSAMVLKSADTLNQSVLDINEQINVIQSELNKKRFESKSISNKKGDATAVNAEIALKETELTELQSKLSDVENRTLYVEQLSEIVDNQGDIIRFADKVFDEFVRKGLPIDATTNDYEQVAYDKAKENYTKNGKLILTNEGAKVVSKTVLENIFTEIGKGIQVLGEMSSKSDEYIKSPEFENFGGATTLIEKYNYAVANFTGLATISNEVSNAVNGQSVKLIDEIKADLENRFGIKIGMNVVTTTTTTTGKGKSIDASKMAKTIELGYGSTSVLLHNCSYTTKGVAESKNTFFPAIEKIVLATATKNFSSATESDTKVSGGWFKSWNGSKEVYKPGFSIENKKLSSVKVRTKNGIVNGAADTDYSGLFHDPIKGVFGTDNVLADVMKQGGCKTAWIKYDGVLVYTQA